MNDKSFLAFLLALLAFFLVALALAAGPRAAPPPPDPLAVYGKPTRTFVRVTGGYAFGCQLWVGSRGYIERCVILGRAKPKPKPNPSQPPA